MSVGAVNKQTGDRIPTAGMPAIDNALSLSSTNPVQNAIITAALADKQDKTDNNLETTAKTIVGAINEHEGDIDSLKSGLTNYENQNNLNLEVPNRKNLLNYDAWKNVGVAHGSAIWENNGVTLTASENDCFTRFEPSYYPNDAKIYVKEGETITLSWEETTNKSGIVMIFPNGNIVGDAYVNNSDAKTVSYIVGSGITFVTFRFGVATSGETISYKNIQIEMGTTATAYTPYIPSVESRIEAVESGLTNLTNVLTISQNSDISKLKDGMNAVLITTGFVIGEAPVTPVTLSNNFRGYIMRNGSNLVGMISNYDSTIIYNISSTTINAISYYKDLT